MHICSRASALQNSECAGQKACLLEINGLLQTICQLQICVLRSSIGFWFGLLLLFRRAAPSHSSDLPLHNGAGFCIDISPGVYATVYTANRSSPCSCTEYS